MDMQLTPVTNRPIFMNSQLEKVTQTILKTGASIQSGRYAISALLAKVESEKLYADDGFKNAIEYANATFGIEKSLAYNLVKMGANFTRPILNDKGRVTGYCSNLLPPADPATQNAPLVDFTPTQITRFMTLGRDKVIQLIEEGSLSPRMTIKEILEVVKANKPPKALETSFTDDPTDVNPEPAEQSEPVQNATQTTTDPHIVPESRDLFDFDNMSTDWLIAELRARGFKVLKGDVEMIFDWGVAHEG